MVSWWPGDGNATDIMGNNDGALLNGTTFTTGKVGQAFSFDGGNDYISVPDDPSLDFTSALTIALWLKADATLDEGIVEKKGTGLSNAPYSLNYYDDSLRFGINDNTSNNLTTPFPQDNQWHFIAATYD